jgi:hypothetical protein
MRARGALVGHALPVGARRARPYGEFELGFPADFIAECEPDPFVFGDHVTAVVGRKKILRRACRGWAFTLDVPVVDGHRGRPAEEER